METKDLWTIVWLNEDGNPDVEIVPSDENPGSEDQGLLVYGSEEAAANSAKIQDELHGDDGHGASAIRLDDFFLLKLL